MAMPDITVMGAGIFGLSVAWCAQSMGARVQVIDPGGPGAGASGGVVGALAPHVPENWNTKKAFQFDSLIMAEAFWTDVQQISGISPGYARLGRLQPVADEAALDLARARAETAQALWQGKATWQVVRAADHDWAPQSPTGWLIHDTLVGAPASTPRLCRSGRSYNCTRGRYSARWQCQRPGGLGHWYP